MLSVSGFSVAELCCLFIIIAYIVNYANQYNIRLTRIKNHRVIVYPFITPGNTFLSVSIFLTGRVYFGVADSIKCK